MEVWKKNNVVIKGRGSKVMLFSHAFGCDQQMWRYMYPHFEEQYKVILFDHVGAGDSDLTAYDRRKYNQLEGYADDVIDIIKSLDATQVIFVGHSVSALIGIIASLKAPHLFSTLILVAPSPSYLNTQGYVGGFSESEIEELLGSLDNNHLGWSHSMAPVIMGNPDRKELAQELANSFCRTTRDIARQFARVTFLSDKRALLPLVNKPTLILQCSNDVIAPLQVGHYMHEHIDGSELVVLKATGHCPNLSAPEETTREILHFLFGK